MASLLRTKGSQDESVFQLDSNLNLGAHSELQFDHGPLVPTPVVGRQVSTGERLVTFAHLSMLPFSRVNCLSRLVLPCRKKGKRKREEAEAAARAQEAAIEETLNSAAAADSADAGMSGSDGEKKKDAVEGSDKEAGEEVDDMLTPAQRRFREKQLEREVRVSLALPQGKAF